MATLKKRKESVLVRGCLVYLCDILGLFAWRNNTGAMRGSYRGKPWFVHFGAKGSGDILGILPNGRFMSIECKKPGETPTDDQEIWAERVRAAGGLPLTIYSLGELEDAMSEVLGRSGPTLGGSRRAGRK
ncbi:MAG: hypothetical protein ABIH03_08290 [Pseudomonadota bacterium]